MAYSDYGLDDVKKPMDEGAAGRSNCLWCQSQVDNGFSMCFSNWVICKKCVETSNKETSETRWITDDCFKCNKKQIRCLSSNTDTVISICEGCLDWAKEVLDIQQKYFLDMSQEILKECTVDRMVVRLPDGKLDRKVYEEVKNALELIGGKWKGGKTQGFVFEEDPSELLAELASGEKRNLKKEFQFFATPPELARIMAKKFVGEIISYDCKVLEPSAGDGALIKAMALEICDDDSNPLVKTIDCFELMELNRMKLAKLAPLAKLIGNDFLKAVQMDELNLIRGQYSHIIANPPFTKNQDIDHIMAMYQCLKPLGKMVTLASPSWQTGNQKKQVDFRNWLITLDAKIEEIQEGTFKESGTSIKTVLIEITKPSVEPTGLGFYDNYVRENDKRSISLRENFKAFESSENFIKAEEKPAKKEKLTTKPQTCKECGCTDDDCSQCIEKTGQPCHWISKDLCSACLKEPQEYLDDILKNETEIFNGIRNLKKMLSPINNNDMNFFRELAAVGNVDMSLRIMQKNGKLTLNVMPASMSASIQPIIITGTPEELDEGFFSNVFPEVQAIAGIASNIKDVKAEVDKKAAAATTKPTAAEKKETKPAAKKAEAPAAKAPAVKQVAAPANDLFGDDDDDVAVAEGGDPDDDQNENDG